MTLRCCRALYAEDRRRSTDEGMVVGGLTLVVRAAHEDQLLVAHADFVARVEIRRPRDFAAVHKRAILGSHLVQLAVGASMDENGTVASRQVGIGERDIVI